jgi:hypothetical protein
MYPSDVLIPIDAKYFGFIDINTEYNPYWDFAWTISYDLSGSQHAFCSFITTTPTLSGGIPGHYVGYLGTSPYITDPNGDYVVSEQGDSLISDPKPLSAYDNSGILSITFDTTGYSALSSEYFPGIALSSVKPNSIVIRNASNKVIYNETCPFDFTSDNTIRFVVSGSLRKLRIDRKVSSGFSNVLTLELSGYSPYLAKKIYTGMTFCSPISSDSLSSSTMGVFGFHSYGETADPTFE